MCGIFGFLNVQLEHQVAERVLDELKCRGPDQQAWVRPSATNGLACARLSLWNEGDCTQPHVYQQWCVAMNGEIFNLAELQAQFELPGASEVQLLAVGWLRYGSEFFGRIDGQFAALLLDSRARVVKAVRDQWGICPLYYSVSGHTIQLGSTMASLAAVRRPTDADLSLEGLLRTAAWWGSSTGATCFKHIRQLQPGHELTFSDGELQVSSFVPGRRSLPTPPGPMDASAMRDLGTVLRKAVSVRSRDTKPIATLLSGGVDSALIAHAAVEAGVRQSFGLVLSNEDDVAVQQRRIAAYLGIMHDIVPIDGRGIVDALPSAIHHIGAPISRLGPIGMYILGRQVTSAGYRSCLSGEGADELFCGYDSFRLARLSLEPPAETKSAAMGRPELGHVSTPLYWRFAQGAQWNPLVGRLAVARFIRHYLTSDVSHEIELLEHESSAFDDCDDKLEAVRQIELSYTLGGYLLGPQGDHVWASQAVEVRYPWLAAPVVNVALHTLARDLFRLDQGKLPVRQLARHWFGDQWLSSEGIDFTKRAYRVDVNLLFTSSQSCSKFEELIAAAPPTIVQVDKTLKLWTRHWAQGSVGDRESSLFTLAATLGALFG